MGWSYDRERFMPERPSGSVIFQFHKPEGLQKRAAFV